MATPTPPLILIDQLRRMVAEPTADTYDDATLESYLARYPLRDAAGALPDNTAWVGRWDANMAAADVWDEKAAAVAMDYDFSADGGQYSRSQAHEQMSAMARRFRARRDASSVPYVANPPRADAVTLREWIGNLPEDDD